MKAAIYSRKSKFTGKGESTQNQIEICKEYLCTHFDIQEYFIYEDEGFSGGNTARPEFQKMMRDATAKKFDILICYRLDRISRNISDFSDLIEVIGDKNINFVSVREQFDTTTPMGRAMMYIASVFAQLERETIAERVKDNMHQLARSGRWLGGTYPTGFRSEPIIYIDANMKEKKMYQLIPIEEELSTVKLIYDKYIELQSLSKVETYCLQNNIKTPQGNDYQKNTLKMILTNPVYAIADDHVYNFFSARNADICNNKKEFNGKNGLTAYNKRVLKNNRLQKVNDFSDWTVAIGKHKGIISGKDWAEVQRTFARNKKDAPRRGTSAAALLSGLMRCSCGSFMRVHYGQMKPNSNERYHYYGCNLRDLSRGSKCNTKRLSGDKTESMVIDYLKHVITTSIFKQIQEAKKKHKNMDQRNKSIKDQIDKNNKSIDNLIKSLANNEDSLAATYIMNELEKLAKENKELGSKINTSSDMELFSLEILEQSCVEFNKKIDSADFNEKRRLIQTIVDKIVWDGDNLDIRLLSL
ncbi:site-specific DNA recombinase [Anaerosolibacter carboniphilus]|uniref:Site-specific DNA recombinase n=1 Tax=Anaerosolibacter carboniphilus TaxID=1417629 RepID=A0A841KRF2_9FIRM|nr:recombinase family protein [Anaerosolibacter carboniphilus]MBB6215997.1 site-specific DNA recombinase [Anaerosolibacter carboniphilus]